MDNCIFCKIINREVPVEIIYENDDIIAILDIMPVNKGHILILPKQHFANIMETPDQTACKVISVAKKMGQSLIASLKCDGFNITNNTNEAAGQSVMHVHFHVIPRYYNDGHFPWKHESYKNDEASEIAKKIKKGVDEIFNVNNS